MLPLLTKIAPRTLFLIDALGALLSALLLGGVLVHWAAWLGLPKQLLYALSFIPILFAVYSFTCYRYLGSAAWQPFMRAIAVANILYCCLTLSILFFHTGKVTFWGWAYFLWEITVILVLARAEWIKASIQTK